MDAFNARLFNFDAFVEGAPLKFDKPVGHGQRLALYRGWMFKPEQYERFFSECSNWGLRLMTSPEQYELMHCFPNAYKRIDGDDTAHIEVFGDTVQATVVNSAFSAFLMKDYVKSVKLTGFPQKIETPVTQERCDELSIEFRRLRGDLFTGGIVCKQFVELARYANRTNEWRGFYFGGSLLSLDGNSMQFEICPAPPEDLVMRMQGLGSPFYTVDFGELEDGSWQVLETGDGQVSGLATEIEAYRFYELLAAALAGEVHA